METLYLSFGCGELSFLVPLEWVHGVADAKARKVGGAHEISGGSDEKVIDLSRYCGPTGGTAAGIYEIGLKDAKISMSLVVDWVAGVVTLESERCFLLPEPARAPSNRYIREVRPLDGAKDSGLAYVIAPEILYDMW